MAATRAKFVRFHSMVLGYQAGEYARFDEIPDELTPYLDGGSAEVITQAAAVDLGLTLADDGDDPDGAD